MTPKETTLMYGFFALVTLGLTVAFFASLYEYKMSGIEAKLDKLTGMSAADSKKYKMNIVLYSLAAIFGALTLLFAFLAFRAHKA
jgi:hypothetical protein